MARIAYYRGCLPGLSARELDLATRALAPKIGLDLVELRSVTCCGAGDIQIADPDYALHLNARILAEAERAGCDTILTICNVCTLNLRQAALRLRGDEELRARVNENLERSGAHRYSGQAEVTHLLWLIARGEGLERLRAAAVKRLDGLRVAPYYGCQLLRPSALTGFEDPDRPASLETVIEACGAQAVDYPAKTLCCGFPILLAREKTSMAELARPLEQALEAGAEAMVTSCPLCHLSLDAWQRSLERREGRKLGLPIFHLSQLVALSAGLEPSELGVSRHVVSLGPVLKRLEPRG
jgi:succinate dehydrogenase / fumarate reductase cytochrome b subunit